MKISKVYTFLNSIIILLTSLFLSLLLILKNNDPEFPNWILVIGFVFWGGSILSFFWNLKTIKVINSGIQINRLLMPDILIQKDEIIEIEESRFRYRGARNSQTVYNGYYLNFRIPNKNYVTSSLNEPDYNSLRKTIHRTFGEIVKLDKDYKGASINWLYVSIMLVPAGYMLVEIIKRI